jgi:RNA polymerase sigma-70 factor (ECF subfamily)
LNSVRQSSALQVPGALTEAAARNRVLDEVMDRYARGEDVAFGEVFRRGAPRVRAFLLRLCLDPGLADDLTQETFLRVHLARGRFARGSAALPWILAVARNVFIDSARHAKVRRSAIAARSSTQPREPEAPAATHGDQLLAAREMAEIVRTTLASMSVTLREAFVLLRFEGMSVAEAAQVLGATEAAVKVRAFRACEQLREALGQEERGCP